MTSRILIALLAIACAFAGTACHHRTSKAKKDGITNTPVAELESSFKQRWIEKRTAELVNSGVAADAAKLKAEEEFKDQYAYVGTRK